jgi:hypothetical protein
VYQHKPRLCSRVRVYLEATSAATKLARRVVGGLRRQLKSSDDYQNFTGADRILVVNSVMTKTTLLAVVALFGFSLLLSAQQPSRSSSNKITLAQLYRLDRSNSGSGFLQPSRFSRLDNPFLVGGFPSWGTFLNRQDFSLSTTFNLIGTGPTFLPTSYAMAQPRARIPAESDKDSPEQAFDVRPNYYVTGEVGFLYGHSSGKFGGDYLNGYIVGEVGNDRFNITVGASHEEWNGRVPRWGR